MYREHPEHIKWHGFPQQCLLSGSAISGTHEHSTTLSSAGFRRPVLTVLSGVRWYSIHRTAPWLFPGLGKGYGMLGQRETALREMSRHSHGSLLLSRNLWSTPLPSCFSQEA